MAVGRARLSSGGLCQWLTGHESMLDDLGYTFAQVATENPLVPVLLALIICLSPVLLLRLALPAIRSLLMVLESLGLGFAFNWAGSHASEPQETKKLRKKKHSRSKSESTTTAYATDGTSSLELLAGS